MTGVPWDDLDPGIVEVVRALDGNGFRTIASCQGHGTGDAWVMILPEEDPMQCVEGVARLIELRGWARSCIVSVRWEVASREPWVEARWWGAIPFR
jgi:hypothetical protein